MTPQCLRYFCALTLLLGITLPGWSRVIATAPSQPNGTLSGRIVFASAGHGWTFDNSSGAWLTQRGENNEMIEDYGNLDQMNFFVTYCFNAGATVVALRPIGYQTNEVVLDNVSPGVRFTGTWQSSSATVNYFRLPGPDTPPSYRFASIDATGSATAIYTPTLPAAGFYPVYTWASHGANRTSQLYLINHTGGQGRVRVPHHMVGNGWVYLGTYHFDAGSNSLTGSVVISSLQPAPTVGSVVIADAIRFGNGMGDVVPVGTNPRISGFPREEECSRYWVQRMLGVGASTSIYDTAGSEDLDDNVGTPPRMAREMNRSEEGSMFKRIFLSFHSNASGSPTPTARGCLALYNGIPGTFTPNQLRLAQLVATEVNNDLVAQTSPPLEVPWFNRSGSALTFSNTFAYGEINNGAISDEFDATLLEVGFHDNPDDALLMRDPRVRALVGRAAYQGILRYMNEFDAVPLTFLPEPPSNVRALANGTGGITVSWSLPGSGGGSATGFLVYRSTNGFGFGNPVGVAGGTTTSVAFDDLAPDLPWYFRVSATNAGGESMPSETVGCRRSSVGVRPILIVNGFDRFDRTINVRQTSGALTFDRVIPARINSFNYVAQHGDAIHRSDVPFDSCQNETILNAQVLLTNYPAVIWALGQESTADETFSFAEQSRVADYLTRGGRLFVSGSEIAWDLDRASGPSASDRAFIHNQLHASLANDDAGTSNFSPTNGAIFSSNLPANFDARSGGAYNIEYPDVLAPSGPDARVALVYTNGTVGAAAIQNTDPATGSQVVYFGFPFETISSAVARDSAMFDILSYFGVIPSPIVSGPLFASPGNAVISWASIPGRRYRVQVKAQLTDPTWINHGPQIVATSNLTSSTNSFGPLSTRVFFRVVIVD